MYQALYRKYRPKTFDDVVGQDVIITTLKNAIIKGNLTHAYLFTGPRGTGKTSVAKILAKTINCTSPLNGMPCGNCVNCTQIKNKEYTDIIEIDAASNNGVDEIRELKDKIDLVPAVGKYKVYIIDEVHMLTVGAFNALLKTLEEPPKHAIFILATTEPQKIPATVLSRCQRFDFKRISNDSIISRIKLICNNENIGITDDAIYEISLFADGGMRDALSLLDEVISYADDKITAEDIHIINGTINQNQIDLFIKSLINNDLSKLLKQMDEWNNCGKSFYKILEELITFFTNIVIFKEAPTYLKEKNVDLSIYEPYVKILKIEEVIKYIDSLNENLNKLKKANNQKLIFELAIIKLMHNKQNRLIKTIEKEEKIVKADIDNVKKVENLEIKHEPTNNNEILNTIKILEEIRINNTLAKFNKKELIKLKDLQEQLNPLIIDSKYCEIVSIILDGTVKAASEDSVIYVFDTESNAKLFNLKISEIENLFAKVFNKSYKVIATDNISWEIIKKEFNNKTKKYEIKDEPTDLINLLDMNNDKDNQIENLFCGNIEYK